MVDVKHRVPPKPWMVNQDARQHRAAPRLPSALALESERIEKLIAVRAQVRAAASLHARSLVKEQRVRRPASAPLLHRPAPAVDPRAQRAASRAQRADAVAAAARLLKNRHRRSPWGFFSCDTCTSAEAALHSVLHVGAPAVLASNRGHVEDGHSADESSSMPDVLLPRPAATDEHRLAFGPFAFRLSPSSEVLAWLAATRLREDLKGAHVLEV